ncbi:hypothetical protein FQR65_LT07521 [Abscondita terminalis]|nr:hypothetical protein FQR65_LT07521 [Abscondita terminalis]
MAGFSCGLPEMENTGQKEEISTLHRDTDYLLMEISAEDFEIDESTCETPSAEKKKKKMTSYEEAVFNLQKRKDEDAIMFQREEHNEEMACIDIEEKIKDHIYQRKVEERQFRTENLKVGLRVGFEYNWLPKNLYF